MLHTAMQPGVTEYHSPKPVGDIDLVNEVRNILISTIGANKVSAFYDTHPFIIEAQNKLSKVQRYFLNRFWYEQFICCKENSTSVRYSLLPTGEINSWLAMFKNVSIHFIVRNNLPKDVRNGE